MPVPFASPVRLPDDERQRLESLARALSEAMTLTMFDIRQNLRLRGAVARELIRMS